MRWTMRLAAVACSIGAVLTAPPIHAQPMESARSEARAWIDAAKSRWSAIYRLLWDYERNQSLAIPHIVGKMSDTEARAAINAARSRFNESAAAVREVIVAGPAPSLSSLGRDDAYAQGLLDAMPGEQISALDRLTELVALLEELELAERIERRLDDSRPKLRLHSFCREHDRLLAQSLRSESMEFPRDSAGDLLYRATSIDFEASSVEHAVRVVVLEGRKVEELPSLNANYGVAYRCIAQHDSCVEGLKAWNGGSDRAHAWHGAIVPAATCPLSRPA